MVDRIYVQRGLQPETIDVSAHDLVLTTLGSLTSASTVGSNDAPPSVDFANAASDPSWKLWKDIAKRQPDFGKPDVFCSDPPSSAFESFSFTVRDGGVFLKRMVEWSGNQPGTGALVTFRDSKGFLSLVVPHQPHFANQPDDTTVFWGYSLNVEAEGDFVKKPIGKCTGREILTEFLGQLQFDDIADHVLAHSICIPAMLPFVMSQFMPRRIADRPHVVPAKALNFAFLGQFVEVADDVVFTVEYSVRCAQIAVYTLLQSSKKVTPIYRGWEDLRNLYKSAKAVLH
ncbi:hypothetical protein HDU91_004426 [Kappamyces sp. JEL0680]|nr:hypothetical protein HDU91_004426 [Kappamyces sp. JEL0680]